MAQGNTQTLRTTNTYAMAVTALMTAVTCILAPLSHTDRTGTDFTYQLCNLSFSLSSGLEERNDQLYPLSSSRTCRTSCIFRIHRRNRKACRTNWRIYHWFHPNGNHCRYCN